MLLQGEQLRPVSNCSSLPQDLHPRKLIRVRRPSKETIEERHGDITYLSCWIEMMECCPCFSADHPCRRGFLYAPENAEKNPKGKRCCVGPSGRGTPPTPTSAPRYCCCPPLPLSRRPRSSTRPHLEQGHYLLPRSWCFVDVRIVPGDAYVEDDRRRDGWSGE